MRMPFPWLGVPFNTRMSEKNKVDLLFLLIKWSHMGTAMLNNPHKNIGCPKLIFIKAKIQKIPTN